MSTETRWWWIRHAPVVDHGGRIYGQRDMACDTSDAAAMSWLAAALPERLRELGIDARALSGLALEAAGQWTGKFNPRPVGETELLELYESAY